MSYFYVVTAWLISSILWGGLGVAIGPGIMMLIVGLIVGGCGCLYSLGEKIFGYQLKLAWAGLIIFTASLTVTLLVLPSLALTTPGYIFMALFLLIPSYLVIFILKKLHV